MFSPGVFSNVCDAVNKNGKSKALQQTVDSSGHVVSGNNKRNIWERTPPPNPSAYKGYKFALDWTGGDGSCPSDCSDVFSAIANDICESSSLLSSPATNIAKQPLRRRPHGWPVQRHDQPSQTRHWLRHLLILHFSSPISITHHLINSSSCYPNRRTDPMCGQPSKLLEMLE